MRWLGTAGGWRTPGQFMSCATLHHPKLIFLSETRMSANRSKNLRWKLGLKNCLGVDCNGLSGGLALFWDDSICVSLLSQGERYIDVLVSDGPDSVPWQATFVYGEPRVENRKDMWNLLSSLCGAWAGPWMMIGNLMKRCGSMSISRTRPDLKGR